MASHRLRNARREGQRHTTVAAGHACRSACPHGLDEIAELATQWLLGHDLDEAAVYDRSAPVLWNETVDLDLLRGVVDRHVRIVLKEARLPYAVRG